jgi:hypothetical protein
MAFPSTTDLNKHRRVHTNEKPFQCPTCQNHFSDRSALRVHMQLHEDRDRFECPEPGCRMTFASELKLDRHRRQEHGLTSNIAPVPAFALPPTTSVSLSHVQPAMAPMPSLHQLQQFMYTDHAPMLNSAAQAALAAALATAETNPLALAHSAAEVVSSVQPNLQLPGLNTFSSSGFPSAISPSSLNAAAPMSQEHPSELMQSVVSAVQHLLAFPTNKAPAHSGMHFQHMHSMPQPQPSLVPSRQVAHTQRPASSFVHDNAAANLMSTLTDLLPRSASPATLASLHNALVAAMNGTSNLQ